MKTNRLYIQVFVVLVVLALLLQIPRLQKATPSTELEEKLKQEAVALLTQQLQLDSPSITVQKVVIEASSARIDIRLTTAANGLEITDLVHVFATHDGKAIIRIFRETSPDFYVYAGQTVR